MTRSNKLARLPEVFSAGRERRSDPWLEVNVIFTTRQGTLAALRAAENLGRLLSARIRLLVAQMVPFAVALDCPPVAVAFIAERCRALALECVETSEVRVDVYLCRDKRELLHRVFKRSSLVVVGGKKRRWRTPERRLADMLQAEGHHVIFVDQRLSRFVGPSRRDDGITPSVMGVTETRPAD